MRRRRREKFGGDVTPHPDHRAEPSRATRSAGVARVPGAHRARVPRQRHLPEGTRRPRRPAHRRRGHLQVQARAEAEGLLGFAWEFAYSWVRTRMAVVEGLARSRVRRHPGLQPARTRTGCWRCCGESAACGSCSTTTTSTPSCSSRASASPTGFAQKLRVRRPDVARAADVPRGRSHHLDERVVQGGRACARGAGGPAT